MVPGTQNGASSASLRSSNSNTSSSEGSLSLKPCDHSCFCSYSFNVLITCFCLCLADKTGFKDYADVVVLASGVVEILLGLGLIFAWKYRVQIGWAVALFFVAIFWGNISQYVNGVNAFGLNSDSARAIRLLFQPVLVIWALWSTGAWRARRHPTHL